MAQPDAMIFMLNGMAARHDDSGTLRPYGEMLDELAPIAGKKELWLAVDADRPEFDRMDTEKITEIFSKERILFLEELGGSPNSAGAFERLAKRVGRSPEECLLLCAGQRLAVSAIDSGFPAAMIISPDRLRREFILRGFLNTDYIMHVRPE